MTIDFKNLTEEQVQLLKNLLDKEKVQKQDLIRKEYRDSVGNKSIDFDENIDEVICAIAKDENVSVEHIYKRYSQFFNLLNHQFVYYKKPPLIYPVWSEFLKYEYGGIKNPENPIVFTENIYNENDSRNSFNLDLMRN